MTNQAMPFGDNWKKKPVQKHYEDVFSKESD